MDIISSVDSEVFNFHDSLSHLVWDKNENVHPEVASKILLIANEFIKFCAIPKTIKIRDITVTGSLSGYNYTKYSDLDIHVIIDYAEFCANEDLAMNYFIMKKNSWSEEFGLLFLSYPIELYVQDYTQYKKGSSPQYSLIKKEWVHRPEKNTGNVDKTTIIKKSKEIMSKITYLEDEFKCDSSADIEDLLNEIKTLKEKIKTMRINSIKENGDSGTGNLVFKVLRNGGFLQRIADLKKNITQKSLSITNNI